MYRNTKSRPFFIQPTKGTNMTAMELYELLNKNGLDYEVIQIFEGKRWVCFEIEEEETNEEENQDIELNGGIDSINE
jgi:hypothetical protein